MATGKTAYILKFLEENFTSDEIRKLLSEAEDLADIKQEQEEKEAMENWEEDPATTVARENFEACQQ